MATELTLQEALAREIAKPQPEAVLVAARHAAARHGKAALGVIYYGSCLRTGQLADRILDFYIIVSDYASAYDNWLLAQANRLLPPNVFYDEVEHLGLRLRSKYAVLSLSDLERRCRPDCRNVSVWARFSQPTALLLCEDDEVRRRIVLALGNAIETLLLAARPLLPDPLQSATLWSSAYDLTYGAELRSEPPGKGREIYLLDRARYDALFPLVTALMPKAVDVKDARRARRRWLLRRIDGKIVSLLRLIKAAFTFDGGIDYLAWKISRHSGVAIEITPWQRRHPVLAGLAMFVRLRLRGAFR